MPNPTRSRLHPSVRTILMGALAALLAVGCASGPKYGAARRKKKSCDCPHWNQRTAPRPPGQGALHAAIDPPPDDPRQ
ncbi:MAG: hypothetical protein JNL05_02950 [Flavobacteriales bacterium]|nr:hypothetical protein [Flavobacteriales bacterium]